MVLNFNPLWSLKICAPALLLWMCDKKYWVTFLGTSGKFPHTDYEGLYVTKTLKRKRSVVFKGARYRFGEFFIRGEMASSFPWEQLVYSVRKKIILSLYYYLINNIHFITDLEFPLQKLHSSSLRWQISNQEQSRRKVLKIRSVGRFWLSQQISFPLMSRVALNVSSDI